MPLQTSVKGILNDKQGRPVTDAVITLTGGSNFFPDIASTTDAMGIFYLDNLVLPGTYNLLINHNGIAVGKTINLQEGDRAFIIEV